MKTKGSNNPTKMQREIILKNAIVPRLNILMFDDPKVTIYENTCQQLYLNQLQKDE